VTRQTTGFGSVEVNDPQIVIALDSSPQQSIDCSDREEDEEILQPLVMRPEPDPIELPEAIVRYPGVRGEQFAGIVPVGGEGGWCLCGSTARQTGEATQSALRWVSLKNKNATQPAAIVAGEWLFDYETSTQHVLTGSLPGKFSRYAGQEIPDHWSLYKLPPGSVTPKLIARLQPSQWRDDRAGHPWAALLPNDRAVLRLPQRIILVDYRAGTVPLEIKLPDLSSYSDPQLSPDQRFLYIRLKTRYTYRIIVDLEEGELVHRLRYPGTIDLGPEYFSADGKRLISLVNDRMLWIDLQAWQVVRCESFPLVSGVGNAFHLFDDRFVLGSGGKLLDLDHNRHTVRMAFYAKDRMLSHPNMALHHDRALMCFESNGIITLGCARAPGDQVTEFLDRLATSDQYRSLRRGDQVRLKLPDVQTEKVKAILEAICAHNGWVISTDSPFVLAARETIPPINRNERAMGTRFLFIVEVSIEDRSLWSSGSDYLEVTPDEVTFWGALDIEPAHGECPAGLDVPETLIDFQSKTGASTVSYNLPRVLGGSRTVSID
jgi:hypothetical protein